MNDINYNELDPLVIPMVKYFNEQGLTTCMSCQGHNKTNMSMFWIQFDKSVTSEDIQEFMKRHLDWQGTFCSCGKFAKRMFGFYSVRDRQWKTEESWNYFAATLEAANSDLEKWKSGINKCGIEGWRGFEDARYTDWLSELKAQGILNE